MKHYGDITKISGYTAPVVDIITGGSPCQDLSVAGKRAGLAGERSGLFMEQVRIVKEMREKDARDTGRTGWAVRPRYMVWENVPGAFSSNGGKDFQAVLEEIVRIVEDEVPDMSTVVQGGWTKSGCLYDKMGAWSVAWRVHDAQFWGVPQRRKRIALVADFGGLSAPEILFERKGVSGDSEPGGEERQGTPAGIEGGAGSTICLQGNGIDRADTAGVGENGNPQFTLSSAHEHAVAVYGVVNKGNGDTFLTPEKHTSLSCGGGEPGQGYPCVMSFQERAGKPGGGKGILIQRDHVGALSTLNNQSVLDNRCWSLDEKMGQTYVHDDMGNTLGARDYKQPQAVYIPIHDKATRYQGGGAGRHDDGGANMLGVGAQDTPMWALSTADRHIVACVEKSTYQDVTGALTPGAHPGSYNGQDAYNDMLVTSPVVFDKEMYNSGKGMTGEMQARHDDVAPTVRADSHPSGVCTSTVRRLTPMECERLQGYPDGWTDIGEWTDSKGKKHKEADSPRYKALGNSIALPFWAWMARRICAQYERTATMASLFDGIGGFPLVFSRAGAVPVWASEIEEFPIAVTKIRFPEVAT